MLKLLEPETRENLRKNTKEETEKETKSFYTPTRSVRSNSTQNNDPNINRKMVTGVLTDSTNQPKRTKVRSQSQPTSKECPVVARTLFAPDKNDGTALPVSKALTSSLPSFDGKSENFELFEELFRNNKKVYPHLTEIQKINYFHSLLRGDTLDAFCNIEDSKKDSLDEIRTKFNTPLAITCQWHKPDVNGMHLYSIPRRKISRNFWMYFKKLQKRLLDRKPNNLSTRQSMRKCLTM